MTTLRRTGRSCGLVATLAVLLACWRVAAAASDELPAPAASPTDAPATSAAATGVPVVAPDVPTVNAVWLGHELSFVYVGQTTYYSCHGLEDKVRYLLRLVGARRDLHVRVSCLEMMGGGVESMPRVEIRAEMPAVATPELLQKLRDDPKRELVARVHGSSPDLELTQFPAAQKVVEIEGRRGARVEDGDCELLEHMSRYVFEPLGLRVLDGSRLHCVYRSVSVGSVRLRIETLQPAPTPDVAPSGAPPVAPPAMPPDTPPTVPPTSRD